MDSISIILLYLIYILRDSIIILFILVCTIVPKKTPRDLIHMHSQCF